MMKELLTDIIGYSAAFFGTILMLPQVYKSYQTKQVKDISMVMLWVYIVNCALWGIYGFLIHSKPILICNIIAEVIGFIQLAIKFKYSSK
jgi:MtN3 and saliva related transmembrane protein